MLTEQRCITYSIYLLWSVRNKFMCSEVHK